MRWFDLQVFSSTELFYIHVRTSIKMLRIRKPKEGRSLADQEDADHNIIPGAWRKDFPLLDGASDLARNTTSRAAKKQREYLCGYYNSSVGSVSWQNDMICVINELF